MPSFSAAAKKALEGAPPTKQEALEARLLSNQEALVDTVSLPLQNWSLARELYRRWTNKFFSFPLQEALQARLLSAIAEVYISATRQGFCMALGRHRVSVLESTLPTDSRLSPSCGFKTGA